jgi:hypothetical protein
VLHRELNQGGCVKWLTGAFGPETCLFNGSQGVFLLNDLWWTVGRMGGMQIRHISPSGTFPVLENYFTFLNPLQQLSRKASLSMGKWDSEVASDWHTACVHLLPPEIGSSQGKGKGILVCAGSWVST